MANNFKTEIRFNKDSSEKIISEVKIQRNRQNPIKMMGVYDGTIVFFNDKFLQKFKVGEVWKMQLTKNNRSDKKFFIGKPLTRVEKIEISISSDADSDKPKACLYLSSGDIDLKSVKEVDYQIEDNMSLEDIAVFFSNNEQNTKIHFHRKVTVPMTDRICKELLKEEHFENGNPEDLTFITVDKSMDLNELVENKIITRKEAIKILKHATRKS